MSLGLKQLKLHKINTLQTNISTENSPDICFSKYRRVSAIANRLILHGLDARQLTSVGGIHDVYAPLSNFRPENEEYIVAWGARSRKLARDLWQRDTTKSRSKFKDTRTTSVAKVPHKVSACT